MMADLLEKLRNLASETKTLTESLQAKIQKVNELQLQLANESERLIQVSIQGQRISLDIEEELKSILEAKKLKVVSMQDIEKIFGDDAEVIIVGEDDETLN